MSLEPRCKALLDSLPPQERAELERLADAQIDTYAGTNPIKRARRLAGVNRSVWILIATHLRCLMLLLAKARRDGTLKPVSWSDDDSSAEVTNEH